MRPCDNEMIFSPADKRILVIFGDIIGFKSWMKRSGRDNLEYTFKRIAEQWKVFRHKADMFKPLGDGFVAVYEINWRNRKSMAAWVLKSTIEMCRNIDEIIESSLGPRPAGFRVRLAEGDGLMYSEVCSKGEVHDYISYYINMAKELLAFREDIPIIVHENLKELLNGRSRKMGIQFKRIRRPHIENTDIFEEDLGMLWSAEMRKGNHKHKIPRR